MCFIQRYGGLHDTYKIKIKNNNDDYNVNDLCVPFAVL